MAEPSEPTEREDPNTWPFTHGGGVARVAVESVFSPMMLERLRDLAAFLRSAQVREVVGAEAVDALVAEIVASKERVKAIMDPLRETLMRNAERLACGVIEPEKWDEIMAAWHAKVGK